jgi:hypothetical protein
MERIPVFGYNSKYKRKMERIFSRKIMCNVLYIKTGTYQYFTNMETNLIRINSEGFNNYVR